MSAAEDIRANARELRKRFFAPRIVKPEPAHLIAVPEATPSNRMHYDAPIGPLLDQRNELREWGVAVRPEVMRMLCRVLCKHRLTWAEVISTRRFLPLVRARWEIFYHLRALGWSLIRTERFMQRDHTTILYGIVRHALDHDLPPLSTSERAGVKGVKAHMAAYRARQLAAHRTQEVLS